MDNTVNTEGASTEPVSKKDLEQVVKRIEALLGPEDKTSSKNPNRSKRDATYLGDKIEQVELVAVPDADVLDDPTTPKYTVTIRDARTPLPDGGSAAVIRTLELFDKDLKGEFIAVYDEIKMRFDSEGHYVPSRAVQQAHALVAEDKKKKPWADNIKAKAFMERATNRPPGSASYTQSSHHGVMKTLTELKPRHRIGPTPLKIVK